MRHPLHFLIVTLFVLTSSLDSRAQVDPAKLPEKMSIDETALCAEIFGGGLPESFEKEMLDREKNIPRKLNFLQEKARTEGIVKTFTHHDIIKNDNDQFSNELQSGPITDQGGSGRCWDFAGCNGVRTYSYYKNLLPLKFEFSQTYIWKAHLAEQANNHFVRMIITKPEPYLSAAGRFLEDVNLQQGGTYRGFAYLVKKYDLVPEAAMPETVATTNPAMLIADLGREVDYTSKLLALALDRKAELPELMEIKKEGNARVRDVLTIYLGKTPTEFKLKASQLDASRIPIDQKGLKEITFTPKEFVKNYLKYNPDDFIVVGSYPMQPFHERYMSLGLGEKDGVTYYDSDFINLPIDRLQELTVKSIDAKMPVWFAADVSTGMDTQNGILHPEIYDHSELFGMTYEERQKQFNAKERSFFRIINPEHAMLITGYDRDPDTQEIIKFKDENSWGKKAGKKGFYNIYPQYFQQNIFEVVIQKDLLSEDEKALTEKAPVLLDPSNPFYTR